MAYDLLFGPTGVDHSRGPSPARAVAGGAGLLVLATVILLPRLQRRREVAKIRAEYSHDYVGQKPAYRLKKTIETPAVPMDELIASGE